MTSATTDDRRRTIRVICTGGTIASRADSTGGAVAQDSPEDLIAGVPGVDEIAHVEVEEVTRVNGWNVTPELMVRTAERVRVAIADGVNGVVVTHGTDTLEETSFVTEMFCRHLTSVAPVLFTGAMRSADEVGSDGPRNLLDAIRLATNDSLRGWGVLVSMHERIYSARWLTKVRTTGMHPYDAASGPIGAIRLGEPIFYGGRPSLEPIGVGPLDSSVAVAAVATGDDGAVLDWHRTRGARGMVLIGSGAGNVPGTYEDPIRRAIAAGVVVVIASRCLGSTAPVYSGPGGGATLAALGVVDGRGLSPAKARLALMAALGHDPDPAAVRSWFAAL
jgi:L-asparaginase